MKELQQGRKRRKVEDGEIEEEHREKVRVYWRKKKERRKG
jgi:hypothetical protein